MLKSCSIRHGIPASCRSAKLQLGFDLDYGATQTSPPIYGERK